MYTIRGKKQLVNERELHALAGKLAADGFSREQVLMIF